jgi:hypothetical protein
MFANPDVTVNGNKILSDNLNATQDKVFGENLTDMVNQPKTILNEYVANYIAIRTIPMLRWTASANINAGKPAFESTYIPQPTAVKRLTINGLKAYATNGKLIVEGEASGMQILVYNTTGQLVWTGLKSDARMEVSLAKGIYLVQGIGKVIVY